MKLRGCRVKTKAHVKEQMAHKVSAISSLRCNMVAKLCHPNRNHTSVLQGEKGHAGAACPAMVFVACSQPHLLLLDSSFLIVPPKALLQPFNPLEFSSEPGCCLFHQSQRQ
eukprot:5822088-Amphidinium_carterae.1